MVIVTLENIKIGDKVIRGRDWKWADQDRNSIYGIITNTREIHHKWCEVDWIDKNGNILSRNVSYRMGAEGDSYDLYYYEEPITISTILQSLDNLETKLLKGEELNGS